MKRTPQPDKRTQRRGATKQTPQALDSTITTIDLLRILHLLTTGRNCWADVWLYRKDTGDKEQKL
jgi:hypothetical protein